MRLSGKEFGGVNKTFSIYVIRSSIAVRWLTAVVRMGVEIEWTNEKSVAFFSRFPSKRKEKAREGKCGFEH